MRRRHPKPTWTSARTRFREAATRKRPRDPHLIAALSLFLIVLHEVLYRLTPGGEYPLFGMVSHAGSDLILMATTLTLATAWLERERNPSARRSPTRTPAADSRRQTAASPSTSR